MNNKKQIWIFTSQKQMVISIILFIIFIAGFIYIGTIDFEKNKENSCQKGSCINYYNYEYIKANEAYDKIKKDNIIILFGVKNNAFVDYYKDIVGLTAQSTGIDTIYYYDITDDRTSHNGAYESIVEYMSDYLTKLDNGVVNIYGPTLFIKKNGVVIYFDDEAAFVKANQSVTNYFNEYQSNLLKINLEAAFNDYLQG